MAEQEKKIAEKKPVEKKAVKAREPSSLARADVGKRIAAALVDGLMTYLICFIPYLGGLIGAAYMAFRDALPLGGEAGQSLGKKLLGLRAVRVPEGTSCDYVTSALRNLPFIIPALMMMRPGMGWVVGSLFWGIVFVVETLLVIADEHGQRIGDRIAKTAVVEA
ncbi:RDD family protein [Candidatus Zixiibacteriota bacterium]